VKYFDSTYFKWFWKICFCLKGRGTSVKEHTDCFVLASLTRIYNIQLWHKHIQKTKHSYMCITSKTIKWKTSNTAGAVARFNQQSLMHIYITSLNFLAWTLNPVKYFDSTYFKWFWKICFCLKGRGTSVKEHTDCFVVVLN
jgi:hypothetical protein